MMTRAASLIITSATALATVALLAIVTSEASQQTSMYVFAWDCSRSFQRHADPARKAFHEAVKALQPSDRVAVIGFDLVPMTLVPPQRMADGESSRSNPLSEAPKCAASSWTVYRSLLDYTTAHFPSEAKLIIFTDGRGTSPRGVNDVDPFTAADTTYRLNENNFILIIGAELPGGDIEPTAIGDLVNQMRPATPSPAALPIWAWPAAGLAVVGVTLLFIRSRGRNGRAFTAALRMEDNRQIRIGPLREAHLPSDIGGSGSSRAVLRANGTHLVLQPLAELTINGERPRGKTQVGSGDRIAYHGQELVIEEVDFA